MRCNKKFIFTLIFCICFMPSFVKATGTYTINSKAATAKSCSIRTQPNEGGTYLIPGQIHWLDPGDIVTVLDDNKIASTVSSCKSGYYYVSYSGYKGYVCGDYISFNANNQYAEQLRQAGFPESYILSLSSLKESYPNWIFTPYNTGVDFEEAISNESNVEYDSNTGKYWSRSYIHSTNELYLSKQTGSYNNGTYQQMEAGGWYAANKQTVAYYMDPRNFLNSYDIFMFENLGYNSSYQTKAAVSKLFESTDLLQYTDYFIEAANYGSNNVSPIFLGARSRQEVVKSDGTLSSSANGTSGVYNFYNIGAYSSCENPVQCGLNYASNRGWTDPRTAIIGGATEIANSYINKNQNTLYFQRWNVTNNLFGNYSHQYMTNIEAAKSESRTTQKGYSSISGLLDSNIEFLIPIYNNMPESAVNLPTTLEEVEKGESIDINSTVSQLGYVIKSQYIIVPLNKSKNDLINELNNKGLTASMDGNSNIVYTGCNLKVSYGDNSVSYAVVVKGDVSGDGKVNAFDYKKIKDYIMGVGTIDGAYKEAADYDNNNSVKAYDYKLIKDYIMSR